MAYRTPEEFDREFVGKLIGVHSNDNTATVWSAANDLIFVDAVGARVMKVMLKIWVMTMGIADGLMRMRTVRIDF